MMEARLQVQLGKLESALRRARLWRRVAWCWIGATVLCVALVLVHRATGWNSRMVWALPLGLGVLAALIVSVIEKNRPRDFRGLALALEAEHPELHPLLTTAIEQQPDRETDEFHFLQRRLINEVVTHRHQRLWSDESQRKLFYAMFVQAGALVVFLAVLFVSQVFAGARHRPNFAPQLSSDEVEVTPGDTKVERGTGLVISARFGGKPPPEATLVLVTASGKTKSLPLERHLADPVFGASLLEVDENGLYRVEYGTKKTRDFKITVFDYPALSRANAALEYPSYTGLTNRTIPDTLRVTAVEGTHLTYTLELNKPVARARLVAKDGGSLPLAVQTNAVALLNGYRLTNSARYSLELVDADGRTNKLQSDFSIQVLTNRTPDVKIAFPRGDQRVSPLEEMQLQASASDDFGVIKYGVGFGVAGQDPKFVELGGALRANEKRQFTNMVSMEKLGVDVDQVVSYFAWADDYGPDGEVRRTFSDMYFAEVRPFDEIFRADQSGESENGQNQRQPGQQGGGNQNTRLAELQKEIVIATWKLQRDQHGPSKKGGSYE
jgi:hypothetical protein